MVDDIIPFRPKSGQWFQGAREALSYTCGPSQRELAADSENLMDGAKNAKLSLGKAPLVFDLDSAGMQKYVD
jgi:hypothetical protein